MVKWNNKEMNANWQISDKMCKKISKASRKREKTRQEGKYCGKLTFTIILRKLPTPISGCRPLAVHVEA